MAPKIPRLQIFLKNQIVKSSRELENICSTVHLDSHCGYDGRPEEVGKEKKVGGLGSNMLRQAEV
jgi:hypothetical protein